MKHRTKQLWAAGLTLTAITCALALDVRLLVQRYTVPLPRLTASLRLALITDLHSTRYGRGQTRLLSALEREQPDFVLLGGDIFDDEIAPEPALELLKALGERYPCFYVTGNHEFWTDRGKEIKDYIAVLGITVLAGTRVTLNKDGQAIDLLGLDDPDVGKASYAQELAALAALPQTGNPSILLAHRPERYNEYLPLHCDLVLNGHAHGGQWRVPVVLNGVWAPHQGLFPTYAGGMYARRGGAIQIISRGLSLESTRIPRIWNRPELVMVHLLPGS